MSSSIKKSLAELFTLLVILAIIISIISSVYLFNLQKALQQISFEDWPVADATMELQIAFFQKMHGIERFTSGDIAAAKMLMSQSKERIATELGRLREAQSIPPVDNRTLSTLAERLDYKVDILLHAHRQSQLHYRLSQDLWDDIEIKMHIIHLANNNAQSPFVLDELLDALQDVLSGMFVRRKYLQTKHTSFRNFVSLDKKIRQDPGYHRITNDYLSYHATALALFTAFENHIVNYNSMIEQNNAVVIVMNRIKAQLERLEAKNRLKMERITEANVKSATQAFNIMIVLTILTILGAFTIAYTTWRKVVEPLHHLVISTKAIAADQPRPLPLQNAADELQYLGDQLNSMDQTIQKKNSELKAYTADLEEQVAQRTTALTEKNIILENEIKVRLATEQQLEKAKEQAVQASLAKGQFLANMSHEIRTPMNAVLGFAQLLLTTPLNHKQTEFVTTINSSGKILLALINDILDYSKIEAGHLEMEQAAFSIEQAFKDILNQFEPTLRNKKLAFSVEIDSGLPRILKGDQIRLQQIITNLVANAIKFTSQGRITITVLPVFNDAKTVMLRCEIQDTGIGIAASEQDKMFRPFEQETNATARKYGGTGLGLAICKQLVSLMGGEIGVHSVKDEGTTFYFTAHFECIASKQQSPQIINQQATPASHNAQEKHKNECRILVVEDDIVNQTLLHEFMLTLGYQADFVDNGSDAVVQLQDKSYDLVFMDIHMPVMNGYEATQQIRELEKSQNRQRITIIALTANATEGERERCIQAGMDDFMTKPISMEKLAEALAMH